MKKIITLKAPKISSDQRKQLTAHKEAVEGAIAEVEGAYAKVKTFRAKEKELEKEALTLHRDAANFQRDAELKLLLNQKTLERLHDAIQLAESECFEWKLPLFNVIDRAQELVRQICQATFNELLDKIATDLSPYYPCFGEARSIVRNAPAVNHLVTNLLTYRAGTNSSIETLFEAGSDTLRKIDALLKGTEIWQFSGGESEAALEPTNSAA